MQAETSGLSGGEATSVVINVSYNQPSASASSAGKVAATAQTSSKVIASKPASTSSGSTYTVVKGDTMWGIAKKFGISLAALEAANPQIKNYNLIYPGQVINIPGSGSSGASSSGGGTSTTTAPAKKADPQPTPAPTVPNDHYDNGTQAILYDVAPGFKKPLVLSGYAKAYFEVTKTKLSSSSSTDNNYVHDTVLVPFLVSPSSFTESRQNQVNIIKTIGGQFVYRLGPNVVNIQLGGMFMDALYQQERSKFLVNFFDDMASDKVDPKSNRYYNDCVISLYIEGWKYTGYVTSVATSKNASVNPLLYQYSISMVATKAAYVYDATSEIANFEADKQNQSRRIYLDPSQTIAPRNGDVYNVILT